ncbi:aldehyde dehydrogenase [Caballeronia novacaledonica]|uniref:Aldehyde dehydrogenase n=1 Tax=Caballeronia novacaledonica TaxID=1544861 RepID=A0ACB5R568_9BURK|nr:aldehyde dehydrogenase [Caballeronia novacaledonica]
MSSDSAATSTVPSVDGECMFDVSLIINNERVGATDGKTFDTRNPISTRIATRASAAGVAEARAAVDAAARAFPVWAELPPGRRRELLLRAADALEARKAAFVDAMMAETGSTSAWADFNVTLGTDMLKEAAVLTTQIRGEVIPSNVPGNLALAVRQAAGVVLGIAPWNAPVILGVRALSTPLACGNTVILKGSELCPRTHSLIVEALIEGGLPPGVVNYVTNAPEDAGAVVEAMIGHPALKRVNFTGSTRVGKIIATTCAKYLKPVVLELGGKAPLLVLDDADLEAAVDAAAFGAFLNQGQICMSTERVVVDNKVADDFMALFSRKARSLRAGDPREAGPAVLGSVVNMATIERCNALIDDAVAKGAQIVAGERADTTLMAATVLDYVTPAMDIYREESFGPIVAVVRVDGEEAAIATANDNEFGLSSAVFTRDAARGIRVAKRIESGICHINGPTVHDEAQMPFGGVKNSGYGRFGGQAGVDEFTELRWITVQTSGRHYPF